MQLNKQFGHALVYDLLNWGFNFSCITFMWKLDHFYAVLVSGLFVLRAVSDAIYRYAMNRELQRQKDLLMAQYNNQAKQLEQSPRMPVEEGSGFEEKESNVTPIKKDLH